MRPSPTHPDNSCDIVSQGVVNGCPKGGLASVTMPSAFEICESKGCNACVQFGQPQTTTQVKVKDLSSGLREGAKVSFKTESHAALKGTTLLLLLPCVIFILSVAVAESLGLFEPAGFALATAVLGLYFYGLRVQLRHYTPYTIVQETTP